MEGGNVAEGSMCTHGRGVRHLERAGDRVLQDHLVPNGMHLAVNDPAAKEDLKGKGATMSAVHSD